MVTFRYYDPNEIFQEGDPAGMCGRANLALAKSFFHSRFHNEAEKHKCNITSDDKIKIGSRSARYDKNTGAAALYVKKEGENIWIPYTLPSPQYLNKEYHYVSYRNKHFESQSELEASAYGHSEKILMRDILNDLISAHPADQYAISKPSSLGKSPKLEDQEYEVLKSLTEKATEYKEYLSSKNLIIKMWSERPACKDHPNKKIEGIKCEDFLKAICPDGSQFGYTVKNYSPPTDCQEKKEKQKEAQKLVQMTYIAFKKAYEKYSLENDLMHQDHASVDIPQDGELCD